MNNKSSAWNGAVRKGGGLQMGERIRLSSGGRGRCLGLQRFLSVKIQEMKLFGPAILPLSIGDKSEQWKPENEVGNAAKIPIALWQGALGSLPRPLQWTWLLLGQLSLFWHQNFPYFFPILGNYYRNPPKTITTTPMALKKPFPTACVYLTTTLPCPIPSQELKTC